MKKWIRLILFGVLLISGMVLFALLLQYGEDIGWWVLPPVTNITRGL